ncbi:hypothetical protein SDC9_164970 [bioreactor metagenome]|uniref:Uncharacterized protein n=1 Tax=bioreactor metagenome TaxID=1076179 RepID=A0A645FT24_9ZZZZ
MHDDDRAGGVLGGGHRDGAEQRGGDPAPAAVAHHEHRRVVPGPHHHAGARPDRVLAGHLEAGVVLVDAVDRLGAADRLRVVLPGGHHPQRQAQPFGGAGGPGHRPAGHRGGVVAHDDGTDCGGALGHGAQSRWRTVAGRDVRGVVPRHPGRGTSGSPPGCRPSCRSGSLPGVPRRDVRTCRGAPDGTGGTDWCHE